VREILNGFGVSFDVLGSYLAGNGLLRGIIMM
jgi:hypothetical protein